MKLYRNAAGLGHRRLPASAPELPRREAPADVSAPQSRKYLLSGPSQTTFAPPPPPALELQTRLCCVKSDRSATFLCVSGSNGDSLDAQSKQETAVCLLMRTASPMCLP